MIFSINFRNWKKIYFIIIEMNLADFLKKYSNISNKFIDDFFGLYEVNNKNIFIIDLENVVK